MLYISKWKATAILLTALICCLLAVPNFFPESTVKRWPAWAQRHIVLGLDLQGGSHILLEVDANDVRRQKLLALQDDVRRVLREARIGLTRAPVVRGNSVEVIIRENDLQQGLTKLRELSQPLSGFLGSTGQRSLDVENVGGGLVRLTVTEPALLERVRQVVDQSVEIIGKRVNQLGLVEPSIQRQGNDRILVQVPGLGDPQQLLDILGKTAKLTFRLVDTSVPVEQALQGRPPPESDIVYGSKAENRQPYLLEKRVIVSGDELTDAQPGFDQRTSEPIVSFKFNTSGARKFAQVTQENVGRPFAIVLDDEVISAPVIREPILGGSGQISGSFTVESANNLAILLRAGALPAKLTVIEQRVVGAGLGQDFDREGQARVLLRRGTRRRVHDRDLRLVRCLCHHCRRHQCGDDFRHSVPPECNAHAPRHHRHRSHHRNCGRQQRAHLRTHSRRGPYRPHAHYRHRRRFQPGAGDHPRFRTSPPSSPPRCCSSSAAVRCAALP